MCCTRLAEYTGRKNLPSRHHRTSLSGHIFATKACIDNRKNLLNTNTSYTCPHNTVNFGPITAENCWRVWGTPANFNGFCILAALLHGNPAVGVSQTLRRWTEGATYIWQGGHHVEHWPTFLVLLLGCTAVLCSAAYCYRWSCVVCQSVCLLVCRSVCLSVTVMSPAKTTEAIEVPFG